MNYIDTNIWIYAIIADPKYGVGCKRILEDIENEKINAIISTQVLTEVIGVLYRQYNVKGAINHLDAILSYPIDVELVTPDIIRKASEYARDYNILPYDAIHIAVCAHRAIKNIVSADKELSKVGFIERIDPIGYK